MNDRDRAFTGIVAKVRSFVQREHAWAELWSGLVMIGWGVQSVFDNQVFSSLPAYSFAVRVVPERVLEIVAILLGVTQIWAIVAERIVIRTGAALCASWFYAMLLLSFLSVDVWPFGWPLGAGWVGINVFAFGRLLRGLR